MTQPLRAASLNKTDQHSMINKLLSTADKMKGRKYTREQRERGHEEKYYPQKSCEGLVIGVIVGFVTEPPSLYK